eukprot:g3241.t1
MGNYDFYTLAVSLMILALQIHNPFLDRSCRESAGPPVRSEAKSSSRGDRGEAAQPYRRREASSDRAPSSSGLSTDALLRELDSIQDKAKEQQATLAAGGRMPPPSPILQHLKDSEAGLSQTEVPRQVRSQTPQAPPPTEWVQAPPAVQAQGGLVRRRDELGQLLQAQMPRGLGVILGVGRGDFALKLLRDWSSAHGLYLVDPFIHQWRGYEDFAYLPDLRNRLEPYEGRYVLVRDFSYSFAEVYRRADQTPGVATFIYIDANHAEEEVTRDLELWWPILASGGLMAGSTYMDDAARKIQVRAAVDRFAQQRQLQDRRELPPKRRRSDRCGHRTGIAWRS